MLSSPTVVGSTVYVGSSDHHLWALNAATGAVRWKVSTGAAVRSSPTVAGNLVVFGSDDGTVRAVDRRTGKVTWARHTGGPVESKPSVSGATVVVTSDDGIVYALSLATGRLKWLRDTGDPLPAAATISNNRVYVGGYSRVLYSLNLSNGRTVWQTDLPTSQYVAPLVHDGKVIVGLSDYGDCDVDGFAGYRALSIDDGAKVWETTGLGCDFGHSAAVAGGGAIYVGSALGQLTKIDPETGSTLATFTTKSWILGAPVVSGRTVYFTTDDQHVYAVSTRPADG